MPGGLLVLRQKTMPLCTTRAVCAVLLVLLAAGLPFSGHAQSPSAAAAAGVTLDFLGQIGGPSYAVAQAGGTVYAGIGRRLVIFNASNPANLYPMGQTSMLGDLVRDVVVRNDLVYVAAGSAGLIIVDVSDPSAPAPLGVYDTSGYALGLDLSGDTLYVADYYGLQIINVSNPQIPYLVASYNSGTQNLQSVDVEGNLAYAGGGTCNYTGCKATLLILDISSLSRITLRSSYTSATTGIVSGLTIRNGTAYLSAAASGLLILDIRNPAAPVVLGTYDMPGETMATRLNGSLAYVANRWGGLRILDISNPAQVQQLGIFRTGHNVMAVSLAGTTAYICDGDDAGGLYAVSVVSPTAPSLLGSYSVPGSPVALSLAGSTIFLADSRGGLKAVDVANPQAPASRGALNTQYRTNGVAVTGNSAYLATGECTGAGCAGSLTIVDVTDSALPILRSVYALPDVATDVLVSGSLAYVAAGYGGGLQIIDVSNPNQPVHVGSYNTLGNAHRLRLAGNLLYMADGYAGLQIIDVSAPATPQLRGSYAMSGFISDVAIQGSLAFLAAGADGLVIVNVSSPSSVRFVGSVQTPGDAQSVVLSGQVAFVGDAWSGLQVVDVSNAANPVICCAFNTAGYAHQVVVANQIAYVADGDGGLLLLREAEALIDGPRTFLPVLLWQQSLSQVGSQAGQRAPTRPAFVP